MESKIKNITYIILKLCHKLISSKIKLNIFKLLVNKLADENKIGLKRINEKISTKKVNNIQKINLIIIILS